MKKRLLALFLVMTMTVSSVVACGKSDSKSSKDEDAEENIEEETETYHFTIWGNEEDLSEEGGNWLKTRCDMFAARYPDDEVVFDFASYSVEEAAEKMEEDREVAPDIFIFESEQTDELVENRLLTRFWGKTEEYVISSNTTSIAHLSTYKDKVYGIPVSANPYVLYYDKNVFGEEDVKQLDTILEKGVLAYPLEDEYYLQAFYEAQDVVEPLEEEPDGTEDESVQSDEGDAQETDVQDNAENLESTESQDVEEEESADSQNSEDEEPQPLEKEAVDAWLRNFKAEPNVVDGSDERGLEGLQNGTVQAAVYDSESYEQVKEILGDNLGVAALPTFVIDGVEKQMKCVTKTKNIGVNPDCENFEMTIALATYLGSADAQQMHYDMSGVLPVNLTAVQTLMDLDLTRVVAQIADKENPGWDIPEEEEEEE